MKNWKELFQSPFHNDQFLPEYVWDDSDHLFLHMHSEDVPVKLMENIVNILNDKPVDIKITRARYVGSNNGSLYLTYEGTEYQIYVRGWGYMTGTLRMKPKEAAEVQDSIGESLVEKISKL